MLVLAPVMCILSGIAISHLLTKFMKNIDAKPQVEHKRGKKLESNFVLRNEVSTAFVGITVVLFVSYTFHCTWVTSEAYR